MLEFIKNLIEEFKEYQIPLGGISIGYRLNRPDETKLEHEAYFMEMVYHSLDLDHIKEITKSKRVMIDENKYIVLFDPKPLIDSLPSLPSQIADFGSGVHEGFFYLNFDDRIWYGLDLTEISKKKLVEIMGKYTQFTCLGVPPKKLDY